MFFFDPQGIVNGVSNGLKVCETAVIPALFPFMVLSDFLVRSKLSEVIGNALAPVTKALFRLPGCAGCAVLMSMAGGYPVGAKMTAQLLENGDISCNQGKRMMLFCVNSGPAFVIGTVGTVIFSSRKAGIILYVSLVVSALIMGIVSRFFDSSSPQIKQKNITFDAKVISKSVTEAMNATLGICAWILIFSCVGPIVDSLPIVKEKTVWIKSLFEVTGGCMDAAAIYPMSIQALIMGWSGLSVHCQLLPYIRATGVKYLHFILSRIMHGALSATVADFLFRIFPCETDVFSSSSQIMPELYSVSIPAAVSMILLAMMLIADMSFKRIKTNNGEA